MPEVEQQQQPQEDRKFPRCGSCRFFHREESRATQGFCYALPPQVTIHTERVRQQSLTGLAVPAGHGPQMAVQQIQRMNLSARPTTAANSPACFLHSPQGFTFVDLLSLVLEILQEPVESSPGPNDSDGGT